MANITVTPIQSFISGETVTPAKLNALAQSGATLDAATIVNADVSPTADIAGSKLADKSIGGQKLNGVADLAAKTADYTLVLADAGRIVEFNSSSNLTLTIPLNSSVAFASGTQVVLTRRGTGDVTVAGAVGVTLRAADSKLKIAKQYAAAACIKIGTDEWLVVGNLKA